MLVLYENIFPLELFVFELLLNVAVVSLHLVELYCLLNYLTLQFPYSLLP